MSALTKPRMTVDQYLDWAVGRPGRYELFQGEVFALSPETLDHADATFVVHTVLRAAIRERQLPCHAVPEGLTVRIDDTTAYEPDALVYCGERLPGGSVEIPAPVIIVEVLSPSTRRIDITTNLADYFRLPSVAHYLIIDLKQPVVIHHARSTGDAMLTRIVREGRIVLDPPGLELAVADIFGT